MKIRIILKSYMKNILITGGFGYIGSVLIKRLLADNYNIIVVDNLLYGQLPILDKKIIHINIDISKIENWEKLLEYQDCVIHLAALVGDPICSKNQELAKKINYEASVKLIEACKKLKIKKFICVSTCSNYGKMANSDNFVNETSELRPVSLYAKLKVEVENHILQNQTSNFCPVILRFATVYGLCENRMRFDLTVNEFTRDSVLRNELIIYGENFWRPYCHISDIAEAIILSLKADEKEIAYQIFNVGSSEENYTKKMIYELLKSENSESRVKFIKQLDDPRDYKVSFEKIKKILNFRPKYKVIDGIKEITKALKENIFINPYAKIYRNEI